MEKVTVKNLIKFTRKSLKNKKGFLNSVQKELEAAKQPRDKDEGGDYWISCVSAVNYIFITDDTSFIKSKMEYLFNKINDTDNLMTKKRFQKNIDILQVFEEFDYTRIKPTSNLTFLEKNKDRSILEIDGLKIEIKPSHIFSFGNQGQREIGAVWFVAFKDGFQKRELGIFSDVIYRYLMRYYSNDFKINPNYCVAVDLFNGQDVSYYQLQTGQIKVILNDTITDIKALL